jgi:nicotinamidase-related amidase
MGNGVDAAEHSAVLLMDLQRDFLDERGRMPVDRRGAEAVIAAANAILFGQALHGALPIAIVNSYPPNSRIANFFRHHAAIAGTEGQKLDARIALPKGMATFAKEHASAFANPELDRFLKAEQVQTLYVLGVFAEGCVRATVLDAIRLGYKVQAIENGIASSAEWKRRFGVWSMKRAGASLIVLDVG